MNAAELIGEVGTQGIELWFEGSRLRFRAPRGALSAEHKALLGEHKAAVVAALREQAARQNELAPLSYGQRSLWFVHLDQPDEADPEHSRGDHHLDDGEAATLHASRLQSARLGG